MAKSVILDTNIVISYLISDRFTQLDELIESSKITIILSDHLIQEIFDVANRPKLQKYLKSKDLLEFFTLVEDHSQLFNPSTHPEFQRDQNDEFLLALALESQADYLLTGDKAILDLKKIGKTKVITFADFLKVIIK